MPVTAKQRRVFEFIRRVIDSNQEPPTIAEIGRHFDMRSSASVHAVLTALEREGLIKRTPNVSRGIQIVQQSEPHGRDHALAAEDEVGEMHVRFFRPAGLRRSAPRDPRSLPIHQPG